MTASPPVWGRHHRAVWAAGLAAHALGLLVGAVLASGLWALLGTWLGHPAPWSLATVALLLALVAAEVIPVHLRGSAWRVPQSWHRLGWVGYSGAFGACLGVGMLTALSSPALYLLVLWGIAAPSWPAAWPVFAAYAAGRAVPLVALAARHGHDEARLHEATVGLQAWLTRLAPVEAALLAAVAVGFLAG